MPEYRAPLRDIQFVLYELLQADQRLAELPAFQYLDRDLMDAVITECARVSEEVLAPLNLSGDVEGCRIEDGVVRTPSGFPKAWKVIADGGWCGLNASEDFGGQGLPQTLGTLMNEMMGAANLSLSDYVGTATGVIEMLEHFAPDDLKAVYLERMIAGEWQGTMCLTEPHCGTDLGQLRVAAKDAGDGTYRISGTKIFISAGDHDLTDNIAHLVLARLDGAPEGVRGISLFLVPKFLPDECGEPGERNRVEAVRLEHKMGYTASATCQMEFDGAKGWLLGEPHRGLMAMFVMINATRLLVAVQGLSTSEAAYQAAAAYARERCSGRSLSGPKYPDKPADPLIVHPDVRRMLLSSRSFNEGARALVLWASILIDRSRHAESEQERTEADDLVALMTPVLKAGLSDMGFTSCNNSVQIFGGHGYIRETGVEQFVRDCRIAQIQEGANGIQAMDLLKRKVFGRTRTALPAFEKRVRATIDEATSLEGLESMAGECADALDRLLSATDWLEGRIEADPEEMGAGGTEYQWMFVLVAMAWMWLRMAIVAQRALADGEGEFYSCKLDTARYFYARTLPMIRGHEAVLKSGAETLMRMDENQF